jgi:16S rRNA (guanine527-N7)-methyltransferase
MTRKAPRVIRKAQDFAANFDVSRETLARLEVYGRLLRQWQKAVNLVAPSTLDDVWHRHFADSAQLLPLAAPGACTWIDLGSGAGFPGLVIAILWADRVPLALGDSPPPGGEGTMKAPDVDARAGKPPRRVVLIESNARKCAFLREVVRQTGIAGGIGVDILSTRIETAATQASLPQPDVVSARALAPLERLLALSAPLFAPTTVGLFMKGREAAAEVEVAKKTWNFNVELIQSQTEPEGQSVLIRQLQPRDRTQDPRM